MKCSRDQWTAALELLKHATIPGSQARTETSMPLADVVVAAEGGRARIVGTDLAVELVAQFDCDGDIEPIALPHASIRKLTRASKMRKGEQMEVERIEHGLRLKIGGRTFDISQSMAVGDRPAAWLGSLDWSSAAIRNFGADAFAAALDYVLPAVSKDPTRDGLRSVYFGDNHMVTTDGHRLHVASDVDSFASGPLCLPSNAATAVRAAIKATDPMYVMARHRTTPGPERVQFSIEGVYLDVLVTSSVSDAQFPPWEQIVPRHKRHFALDASAFVQCMATAAKLSGLGGVRLDSDDELAVGIDGSFAEVIPLTGHKGSAKLAANPRYLLEAAAGTEETIRVEYGDELDPILVRVGPDRYGIVMPMRR